MSIISPNKKSLPMLLAGLAMMIYVICQFITLTVSNILEMINYGTLVLQNGIPVLNLVTIFINNVIGDISFSIWMILLFIVGIPFIIAFIIPGKITYGVAYSSLGLLGLGYGIFSVINIVINVMSLIATYPTVTEYARITVIFQYVLKILNTGSAIHWIPVILLTVFAIIGLIPKAGKIGGNMWIIPVVLSGVEVVVRFVGGIVSRLFFNVNFLASIFNAGFSLVAIGFTVCLLLAGIAMTFSVLGNFGKKNA